jgi:hypothetical protein
METKTTDGLRLPESRRWLWIRDTGPLIDGIRRQRRRDLSLQERVIAARQWLEDRDGEICLPDDQDAKAESLALHLQLGLRFSLPHSILLEVSRAHLIESAAKQKLALEAWLRKAGTFVTVCIDKFPSLDRFQVAEVVGRLRREAEAAADAANPISLLSDDELRAILKMANLSGIKPAHDPSR